MPKISLYDEKDPRSIEAYAKQLINKNLRQFLLPQEIRKLSNVKGGEDYFGSEGWKHFFGVED